MATSATIELVLTCGSWQEAQRIVDGLMSKQLIHNAEFLPVADEVKLIMVSVEHFFHDIEAEVKKLHGSKQPALKMMPQTAIH